MSIARRAFSSSASRAKNVVLVDGVRIPFATSQSTYMDDMAYDLGRWAMKGLLTKTAVNPSDIDYVLFGTVLQEIRTSNIARESALGAGIPRHVPAHTVTQACVSSSQAICTGIEKIMAGQAKTIVAGGVETFSDVPIRYSRPVRKRMLGAAKAMKKGPAGILGLLKGLGLKDLAPVPPAIQNFLTGEIMGHSSDRLASRFGVSRADQDDLAVRSHVNGARAHAEGLYDGEVISVKDGSTTENGIRGESNMESMGKLKAAFVKPHGTHTAANSSFLTDGASACLIMDEEEALKQGFKPKAYFRSHTFVAVDPFEEMLLGPTYATNKVLRQMGLDMKDMDVVEIHEAFAGQVLANLTAMGSSKFASEELGQSSAVGEVDQSKMNLWGGSLSLGHPFGATGARLVTTAANRLIHEDGKYALVTACADSGIGHAAILERYPQ